MRQTLTACQVRPIYKVSELVMADILSSSVPGGQGGHLKGGPIKGGHTLRDMVISGYRMFRSRSCSEWLI